MKTGLAKPAGDIHLLSVVVQSLILASGGILSVGSITIVILLLISEGGRRSGLAYAAGYVGGYTVIGVATIFFGTAALESRSGGGGSALSAALAALGLLLLWIALRNWRRPPADEDQSPRFFALLDRITPPRAFGFGALVTVVNFKNLAIFLSAVSVALTSELPLLSRIAVALLVVIVFCTSVIVPVTISLVFPDQADRRLSRIKGALETHRRQIGIWVPLVFGLLFLTRGILGLL